ncbi:hypothetical protein H4P12_17405 [Paracoccus sp. 11-3]|uniref:Uncharacterized protein n=1 Tax=Paracoccus amoyensis TaxID=2760093 RepID=A0A926G9N9_9RHOB|nr:hypothetical protein [Paracoccus amoyensis]MBC9248443.1 hypothetical protein [Paracoccus amoyensis]
MITNFHLTKDDNEDISFASSCLVSGVITLEEFKAWAYSIVENEKDVPSYIFDIVELENKFDYTLNMHRIIGFFPSWELSGEEDAALEGIGYKRYKDFSSDFAPRNQALAALEKNPQVEERFLRTFPFIKI